MGCLLARLLAAGVSSPRSQIMTSQGRLSYGSPAKHFIKCSTRTIYFSPIKISITYSGKYVSMFNNTLKYIFTVRSRSRFSSEAGVNKIRQSRLRFKTLPRLELTQKKMIYL